MFSTENRLGVFHAPGGAAGELVLSRLAGFEAVNSPFEFTVECLGESANIDFDSMLGKNATVVVNPIDPSHPKRHFDGLVTGSQWLGIHDGAHRYGLSLRPWLWLLSFRVNQRIFHNKSVPEILDAVFGDHGRRCENRLQNSYQPVEYIVQYRESDFDFVHRLMASAGISYTFSHALHQHDLIIFDDVESLPLIPGGSRVYRVSDRQYRDRQEHLRDWVSRRQFTTGKVMLTDYDFAQPNSNLDAERTAGSGYSHGDIESFVYPGGYSKPDIGREIADLRLKQVLAPDRRHHATGDCLTLLAGMRVVVTDHPDASIGGQSFVAVAISHTLTAENYRSGAGGGGESYDAQYELSSTSLPIVPPHEPAVPSVHGPQTATVVGDGEIDCDEHGRILVRFHWDREGAWSMRCRVAQMAAGAAWGGIVIPRVGMEVVVNFIDGDPSKPLVVATVYNGNNKPPFELPGKNMVSGIKTNSTPGGGGYNEIALDDSKGREEFRLHAQYDLNAKILHDETRKVDNSRTATIGVNDTLKVGDTLKVEAGTKIELKVGGSKITMDAMSITLESPKIEIKASMEFKSAAGMMSEHNAGALFDIKGALVKINT